MKLRIKLSLTALLMSVTTFAAADTVIMDDAIVQGSVCVGTPCIDGEVFEFDTLRIKSTTPQIRFQDTSNSASFPSQDWLMGIASDSAMSSVFFIQDTTSTEKVLQIENGTDGGVALGAGSVLESGAISVGADGSERRIAYVADAVNATDAVTLSQFNTFESDATAAAAADIATVNSEISDLQAEMVLLNQRLNEVVNRLNALP